MFDLEKALASWRQSYAFKRSILPEDLDELEIHVRDQVQGLVQQGVTPQAAYQEAIRQMGDCALTESAYRHVLWPKLHRTQRLSDHVFHELAMLLTNARLTLRHLRKNKTYTLLNVVTLALGIACCGFILLFIHDEYSFDRYHENADTIYRVNNDMIGLSMQRGVTPPPRPNRHSPPAIASILAASIPEIEQTTLIDQDMRVVQSESATAFEEHFYEADPSVFDVFTLTLLHGTPETALSQPRNLVLTASMANKYFGETNVLGRTLYTNQNILGVRTGAGIGSETYTITGVLADMPATSTIQFDFLAALEDEDPQSWSNFRFVLYARTTPDADPDRLEAQLLEGYEAHTQDVRRFVRITNFELERLTDIYLHSPWGGENGKSSDIRYMYIFATAALLLLFIACLSYINQALVLSLKRTREVGIRKVVGATRLQLVRQFLSESIVLGVVAFALALGLIYALLPAFNQLANKSITFAVLSERWIWYYIGGAALVLGILAGSYPALFLSRFDPITVLIRLTGTGRSGIWFRRTLVVVQFTIAIGFVLTTVVLYQQLDYIQQKNLGFDEEQLVVVRLETGARPHALPLKQELLRQPGILRVTRSSGIPLVAPAYDEGKGNGGESPEYNKNIYVDHDFIETYGMTIVQGRNLNTEDPIGRTSRNRVALVNEARAREIGDDAVLGTRATAQGSEIVGVVKDFHFSSLHQPISSFQMTYGVRNPKFLTIRIAPEHIPGTLEAIEATYHSIIPDEPFSFFFIDERIDAQYRNDQRIADILGLFALLTLGLASISLIAIASFSTAQRVREIGIRKVLGASGMSIVLLLSRGFIALVLLAILCALPLGFIGLDWWLQDFAYRVTIPWEFFGTVGGGALVLAIVAVGVQALRAALANPIDAIRTE